MLCTLKYLLIFLRLFPWLMNFISRNLLSNSILKAHKKFFLNYPAIYLRLPTNFFFLSCKPIRAVDARLLCKLRQITAFVWILENETDKTIESRISLENFEYKVFLWCISLYMFSYIMMSERPQKALYAVKIPLSHI